MSVVTERRNPQRDVLDRFATRVLVGDGCWGWTGSFNSSGYAQLYLRPGRSLVAHRFAYELLVGPIPEGMVLDHLCRNRACSNPSHLEIVTRGENTLRGETITAANRDKTHCKRGHEFDDANTYLRYGKRSCRTCRTDSTRERRAA